MPSELPSNFYELQIMQSTLSNPFEECSSEGENEGPVTMFESLEVYSESLEKIIFNTTGNEEPPAPQVPSPQERE